MKLTKAHTKEELEAVLSDGHPSEETIRQNLSHIRGSKADIFTQAIVDISTLLNRVSDSADPGMAFDDSGEDLDQRDEDYGAWNDQLDQVEQDPVYRKAVQDLIGLNVTTEDGTEIPIVSVDMRGDGYTAETAVGIRFGNFLRKSGKSRLEARIDSILADARIVGRDRTAMHYIADFYKRNKRLTAGRRRCLLDIEERLKAAPISIDPSMKSRTMQRPILVDEMGVDHRTVQKITEIN